jgi:DNA-binding SARP family transcriptional activator
MLEFRILGPVEVVRDGEPLQLGGAKQRGLIADLTLHANDVVSADRLIDDLWGDEPPETASHMLHVYVSRLRKTLEDHGRSVLVTRPPGYVLKLEPPDRLDAGEFETDVRRGTEALDARPGDALELFDRALAAWRGRALEEFSADAFARPSAVRLEGLRQSAYESRTEALLALGRHEEALVELEGLIARFPLRERLRELQMLALYRAGRQADALAAFQAARRALSDELGIDPGLGLRSLEEAILRQDEDLQAGPPLLDGEAAAVPPPTTGEPVEPDHRPAHRPRPVRLIVVSIVTTLVVGTIAFVLLTRNPGGPSASGKAGPLSWSEVPSHKAFLGKGDQVIEGGTATSLGYLALGHTAAPRSSPTGTRDYDAAVWLARAPGLWNWLPAPPFTGSGNQAAADGVAFDEDLIIVGRDSSRGNFDAAVWISRNVGATWSRTGEANLREEGDQEMRDVIVTHGRLVGVGDDRSPDGRTQASVWTSTDAKVWSHTSIPGLTLEADTEMSSVATLGSRVVAGGYVSTAEDGRDAAVWWSDEPGVGSSWALGSGSLGGEGDQQINAIVAGGPGLVAVGSETNGTDTDAAVWTSSDGMDWDRVPDPGDVFGGSGSQRMFTVATTTLGIVAGGVDGSHAGIWLSEDGRSWHREGASPRTSALANATVKVLIPAPHQLIALGAVRRGSGSDADAWIGRPR